MLFENVHELFLNYEIASNDYKLSTGQKLAYPHKHFDGKAKQYCHSISFAKAKSHEDAKENVMKIFDTRTR